MLVDFDRGLELPGGELQATKLSIIPTRLSTIQSRLSLGLSCLQVPTSSFFQWHVRRITLHFAAAMA